MGGGKREPHVVLSAPLHNKRLLLSRWTSGSRAPLAVTTLGAQQNRETLDGLVSSRGGVLRSVLD